MFKQPLKPDPGEKTSQSSLTGAPDHRVPTTHPHTPTLRVCSDSRRLMQVHQQLHRAECAAAWGQSCTYTPNTRRVPIFSVLEAQGRVMPPSDCIAPGP